MLAFIERYVDEHRRSPLIREIQLGCEIASYKSVVDRLNALERKRCIKRIPNKHRGIKLAHRASQAALQLQLQANAASIEASSLEGEV